MATRTAKRTAKKLPAKYGPPRLKRADHKVPQRDFAPAHAEVGSWVEFDKVIGYHTGTGETFTRPTIGQVWATKCGGKRAEVWVADGEDFHLERVADLRPVASPAEQLELEV